MLLDRSNRVLATAEELDAAFRIERFASAEGHRQQTFGLLLGLVPALVERMAPSMQNNKGRPMALGMG